MVSFSELWNVIENSNTTPLMGSGNEDRAISAIRSGRDLRSKEETSFWDDFISLCSNEGFADLLDVNKEKLSTWPAKIKELLNKIEDVKHEDPEHEDDTELMATGDNGAFTVNSDPNLGVM